VVDAVGHAYFTQATIVYSVILLVINSSRALPALAKRSHTSI
jgi:hypothetical protein